MRPGPWPKVPELTARAAEESLTTLIHSRLAGCDGQRGRRAHGEGQLLQASRNPPDPTIRACGGDRRRKSKGGCHRSNDGTPDQAASRMGARVTDCVVWKLRQLAMSLLPRTQGPAQTNGQVPTRRSVARSDE